VVLRRPPINTSFTSDGSKILVLSTLDNFLIPFVETTFVEITLFKIGPAAEKIE
jgi:hypothetical protein